MKLEHALDSLWQVLKKLASTLGSAVAPLLTAFAEHVTDLIVKATAWVKQNKDLIVSVFKIGLAIQLAGFALIGFAERCSSPRAKRSVCSRRLSARSAACWEPWLSRDCRRSVAHRAGDYRRRGAWRIPYICYRAQAGKPWHGWVNGSLNLSTSPCVAFQGIADALAAGDIGLAAKILWLTLKSRVRVKASAGPANRSLAHLPGFFIQIAYDAFYGARRRGRSSRTPGSSGVDRNNGIPIQDVDQLHRGLHRRRGTMP